MAAKVAQDQHLEKITNRAWRTWWFLFYLLIIPATVAIVSYFLSNYLSRNAFFAMNFTVIATLASFFIVYKLFDKYLEAPILKNKASNANFRVHAPFFFSMVALTSAFAILLFTQEQNLFKPLPLIALGVVYSFTWIYYRWKPIDEIDQAGKAFKHAATLQAAAKIFHNIVVFFHLAFQFTMISFYMNNPLLWGGIGIPINVIFWILAIKLTAGSRAQLEKGLIAGKDVTTPFLVFKKNFAQVMVAACASLMIINIFYPLIATPGLFAKFSWLMLFIFGLVIAGVLLVKIETYVAIYFAKQIAAAASKDHPAKEAAAVAPVLNKLSLYATVVLIATSLVMGFVPEIPAATSITVVAVYAMVLGERGAKLTEGHWYSYSHLANTVCLLASISFGVLPSMPFIHVPFIVQATIFIVALYATIEAYCAARYLKKHQISMLQDSMAICSFALVAISFHETILAVYTAGAGLIGVATRISAAVAVAALLAGIVMLLACYRLYRTRYHHRTDRRVKAWFSASFAWIASAITSMAMLGMRHLPVVDPVDLVVGTALWWAGSFMAFVGINCIFGIFFGHDLVEVTYRAVLVYVAGISALVIYHFPTFAPVLSAC
ncbi:MAG: hypothetical protein GYA24_09990, partial [Candidatus Lokiarchaeota archaeon]|nr:hypothetical protein [Candidatus Lokiarchaeota archaeon]